MREPIVSTKVLGETLKGEVNLVFLVFFVDFRCLIIYECVDTCSLTTS